jgi:hypothetical protein
VIHESLNVRGHHTSAAARIVLLNAITGQGQEMTRLAGLEPKCFGNALQSLCGRAHIARLFQPLVPLGAHASQPRYLLAAQTGCTSPLTIR